MSEKNIENGMHPIDNVRYRVYNSKRISSLLKYTGYLAVALAAVAYAVRLASFFTVGGISLSHLAAFIITTAVPFAAVSIVRRLINAPRPYEMLDFYEVKPKDKCGQGFPSRHVFSIFLIAASVALWRPYIAVVLAVLGIVLAASRVLLGIHYVRDVVCGAILGTVSGVIGLAVTAAIL